MGKKNQAVLSTSAKQSDETIAESFERPMMIHPSRKKKDAAFRRTRTDVGGCHQLCPMTQIESDDSFAFFLRLLSFASPKSVRVCAARIAPASSCFFRSIVVPSLLVVGIERQGRLVQGGILFLLLLDVGAAVQEPLVDLLVVLVLHGLDHFSEEGLPGRSRGPHGGRHDAGVVVVAVVGPAAAARRHGRSVRGPRQELLRRFADVLLLLLRLVVVAAARRPRRCGRFGGGGFGLQALVLLVQLLDFVLRQRRGIVLFGDVEFLVFLVVRRVYDRRPAGLRRFDLVQNDVFGRVVLLVHEEHSQATDFLLGLCQLVLHGLDLRNLLQELRLEVIAFFLQAKEVVLEFPPGLDVTDYGHDSIALNLFLMR
mmetsp:Transcript_6177/g.15282  ORF Transcript_6177/g.15282 Transcript_6177/m.15282 type:complete len:369 (-) Transcript_6177:393-1499(-)